MDHQNKDNEIMGPPTVFRDEEGIGDDDYRRKRDKNNEAVKKSRIKNRMRIEQTSQHVNQLKTENGRLEEENKSLNEEVAVLRKIKDALFNKSKIELPESVDLKTLLSDTTPSILDDD